jgi:hypothetical protein
MAELTQQDRDNYKKLQELVDALRQAITTADQSKHKAIEFLKSLFEQIFLAKPPDPALPNELNTAEDLESRLDQIDAYLIPQNLLLQSPPDEINKATQELLKQSDLIKESLQDIKDADLSTLDDLESPCTDAQFFELITGQNCQNTNLLKNWTKRLLAGHSLKLSSENISQLTDAWAIAVSGIIKDAQKTGGIEPGTPDTIARFFCIHEELEDLYDKVSNLVA